MCKEWVLSALKAPDCPIVVPVTWRKLATILPVVRTILSSKAACKLSDTDTGLLSTLVLQSFLAALPENMSTAEIAQTIRVQGLIGRPVSDSRMDSCAVYIDTSLPASMPSGTASARLRGVVLYECSLCLTEPSVAFTSETATGADGAASLWSVGSVEEKAMAELGAALRGLGVGVVATQKLMHPSLERVLLDAGILPLQRLSIRHVAAVQAVTGAAVLSSWQRPVDPRCLGLLDSFHLTTTERGKQALILKGPPHTAKLSPDKTPMLQGKATPPDLWAACLKRIRPVVTLSVCNLSAHALSETKLAIKVCC